MMLTTHTSLVVCAVLAALPFSSSQGTVLGDGIITRTDVGEFADLSLDLRDIRESIKAGNKDKAKGIYLDGENAEFTPGRRTPLKITSDNLAAATDRTPWYLFHLFGLSDLSNDLTELSKHLNYADTFIQVAFEESLEQADHAILALGMWMYGTHLLYDGAALCEKRTNADNPVLFDVKGGGIDEFMALWVGVEQTVATTTGHSLYAWAQESGNKFGVANPEAPVNTNIKLWYQEAASALSISKACTSENLNTVEALYSVSNRISRQMVVPLYQWLLSYIIDDNARGAHIYGQALIPQLSKCRGSVFKRLQSFFLTSDGVDLSLANDMIRDLKESYSCFGLTCEDIGVYKDDRRLSCNSTDVRQYEKVAGFLPAADAEPYARVDLDVRQLRLMTELEALQHARMLYLYGGNAIKRQQTENDPLVYHSLAKFATVANRYEAGDLYTHYVEYHGDNRYSHNLVLSVLEGESKWQTPTQRAQAIAIACTHQVVFITIALLINQSLEACRDSHSDGAKMDIAGRRWDEAVLLIIGSLEGRSLGGSPDLRDSEFIYGLANRLAFQFDARNELSYARVNSALEDLVYAGRAEVDTKDCINFERTAVELYSLLYVGMFQATIASALENENLQSDATAVSLAEAESFALSIIPSIHAGDPQIAEVLSENLVWKSSAKPVRDGAVEVGDALGDAFQRIIGLHCSSWLGSTGSVDPCRLLEKNQGASSSSKVNLTVIFLFAVAFAARHIV